MEVRPFVDEEIEPVGVLRVETENSIWFVTAERYQRLPREERPRPAVRSIERRLADGQWHRLRRCWWRVHHDGERQIRLLPGVGPADGVGVITGLIVDPTIRSLRRGISAVEARIPHRRQPLHLLRP